MVCLTEKGHLGSLPYQLLKKLLKELMPLASLLFTGASTGIGAESTHVLALRGAHVFMAIRNMAAGTDAKDAIIKEIPTAKVDILELDLSSLASVRKFASDFTIKGLPLNILITTAGIMACPFMLSKDNIELQFATNHLDSTAQESGRREGRIVNVSSGGHRFTYHEGIRFHKFNDQSGYKNFLAYGQSKLANILHANELARHLKEDGLEITANSLHPGAINTNLFRQEGFVNALLGFLGKFVFRNVQQGVQHVMLRCIHKLKGRVASISKTVT